MSDVIFSLPRLYYYASKIADKIIKINPKIIVTVDTKGFNFYLIKLIRHKLKTKNNMPKFIHIVAPTVWAWRANRANKVSKIVDTLLCLFPREPNYFDKNKREFNEGKQLFHRQQLITHQIQVLSKLLMAKGSRLTSFLTLLEH